MDWLVKILQHGPDNLSVDILLVIALIFFLFRMSDLYKSMLKTMTSMDEKQKFFSEQLHSIIDQQNRLLRYLVHSIVGGDDDEETKGDRK